MDCSERTYFRRQNRLADKFNALLLRRGLSEDWFMTTYSGVPYVMAALEKVRAGGEKSFCDKRVRRTVRFSDGSGKGERDEKEKPLSV